MLRDQDLESRLKELNELKMAYDAYKEESTRTKSELQARVENLEKTLLVMHPFILC